jgi:hypothetical protein
MASPLPDSGERKRCGTCALWGYTADVQIGPNTTARTGECKWDVTTPFSMVRLWMGSEEGEGCPCWKERDDRD